MNKKHFSKQKPSKKNSTTDETYDDAKRFHVKLSIDGHTCYMQNNTEQVFYRSNLSQKYKYTSKWLIDGIFLNRKTKTKQKKTSETQ